MTKYVRTENGLEKMTDAEYEVYLESLKPKKTYLDFRVEAYGSVESQIEFITEHGIDAWQAKVAEIKSLYPKTQ